MSVSKLTIVAQLRDELTAPLKKVIKGLDEASAAAAKGAVSADRQADAFNRLAHEAGWSTNRMGRWVNENNRVVSKADRAAMGISALSLATHEAADATRRQEEAFKGVVHAAGYKIASDGSVRNALGLFVKQQDVAVMRTMAAAQATQRATSAGKDYGDQAVKQARYTRLMNEAYDLQVKSLGYTYNSQGKLVNVLGRTISRTEIAEHRAAAAAYATQQLADAANKTGVFTTRAGEAVGFFSRNAVVAGNTVEQLAKRFGASDTAARNMGVALGNSLNSGAVANGVAAFKRNLDSIYTHAQSTASKIESAMGKALKVGGIAAGAGAAYAIHGGMGRINALESSDVKLEVQDYTPEERTAIKDEVNEMVKGTFLSLPQALDTAQGLLGSGVKYGEDFTEYMGYTIDAQSIYSSHDPKQLELVLRQIQAKEHLTGEERNQLAELGMPVNEWLADSMDVPMNEIMDKIAAKEVSADDWWKAMGKGVEGGAELMGKTFAGAWINFLAAVKRSGQFFDQPLLEPMKRGLHAMTDILDENEEFFRRLGQAASVGMSEAADTIPEVLTALEPLGPSLIRLMDAVSPILPQIVQGFANWVQIITPLLILLIEFTTILLEITGPLLPVLIPLLLGTLAAFKGYGILKDINANHAKFIALLKGGTWALTLKKGAIMGAKVAMDLLTKSIMMFPGLWIVTAIILVVGLLGELYDNAEWAKDAMDWLSDGFRNADEWLNNFGESIDKFFEKNFPKLHKLNEILAIPLNFINEGLSGLGGDIGEGTGLHEQLGTGQHANTGQGLFRWWQGSGSHDEEGNPYGQDNLLESTMDPDRGGPQQQIDTLMDPLPGSAQQYSDQAPEDSGRNFFDLSNGGLPPMSWNAPPSAEEQLKGQLGYADGGWTSPGSINVGERGREFITSAWAANQVENTSPGAMQYINDTGTLPPTGGITIHAPVTISGAEDPERIRAIVMAAIQDAAREAEREYMTPSVRGAG